ncbi:MAG: serine phosphatase RsbU (regulator of sigma subunit) [Parvicella sp.]|jgi:serine phosphatase RsbU (regulator of sigma subunit)/HAMP domain-containing protein
MRFTVGKKIGIGFIIVGLLMVVVFGITIFEVTDAQKTLDTSLSTNKQITEVDGPTVIYLEEFENHLKDLAVNTNNWVYDESNNIAPFDNINALLDSLLTADTSALNDISKKWTSDIETDIASYQELKKELVALVVQVRKITEEILPTFESKRDFASQMESRLAYDDDISPAIASIITNLSVLLDKKKEETAKKKELSNVQFEETTTGLGSLLKIIIFAMIVLAVGTFFIAIITTRSITKPVQELKRILLDLGKGIFPRSKIDPSNDEIGEMSIAMNSLVHGLKGTTDFATEVGKSNFEVPYTPLSDEDELGKALVKMRDELAESERILEQKVKDRTAEVVQKAAEIEEQNEKLEELYTDVTASIRYAKRLQDSILPTDQFIKKVLPESFVLFKPKDIVSGDFYWCVETEEKVLFASVDCTGHGVPGAFMSLIGANALNQIINKQVDNPAEILNQLNKLSSDALNKSEEGRDKVRDGMDMAICAISKDGKTLEYAGANNPLYLIRDEELIITKADKFAIASFEDGDQQYQNHRFEVQKGDVLYIFSDGYADQFGGVKGKKFMYRQFRELLMHIKNKPMNEQKEILDSKLEDWRGQFEQVDDILVIGVRIV